MINVCTVSDKNYLVKGLTLYRSIKDDNVTLHYLCMDKKSYLIIKGIDDPNLIPYNVEDFTREDLVLKQLSQEDHKYYSFCLASYFSNFLLQNFESITYVDSDIYFYKPLDYLLKAIGEKEIGVFRHRQYSLKVPNGNGWFNVGVVHFKHTATGLAALNWWSDAVLNKKYPELATCGDQRYLDAFTQIDEEKLFVDGNIGHGAPWEWQLYNYSYYSRFKSLSWYGNPQPLVFSHFSQFEYDLKDDTYIPSTDHYCFTPLEMYTDNEELKSIYDEYFEEIKTTVKEYRIRI